MLTLRHILVKFLDSKQRSKEKRICQHLGNRVSRLSREFVVKKLQIKGFTFSVIHVKMEIMVEMLR